MLQMVGPRRVPLVRVALLASSLLATSSAFAAEAARTATLTPRTVPVPLRDMVLSVPVSGDVTYETRNGTASVAGRLTGDLAAAQHQSTAVLRQLIDRDQACGDRIAVRDGQLGARAPALRVIANVDYERVACVAGKHMTVVPRRPVYLDMLLYPVVGPRSLRVRAEVLDVRTSGAELPASGDGALKETLSRLVSDRIGELFPAGAAPADFALKSIAFDEVRPGLLVARLEGSGSLPQSTLEQLIRRN